MFGDSAAPFWGALIESVSAIGGALFAVFGIVIARLVLRIRWLAIGVTMLFLSLIATYDMSPMPYSVFFHGGYAMHGTGYVRSLGRPASHGCVRLHPANAALFYNLVREYGLGNARIVITR